MVDTLLQFDEELRLVPVFPVFQAIPKTKSECH